MTMWPFILGRSLPDSGDGVVVVTVMMVVVKVVVVVMVWWRW